MIPVLTAEEARALEREAEARGTSVEVLMERAGHAVARAAAELAGGSYGRRAVVVAGKGNNAGDGFVAARFLASWGMRATVVLVGEADELREPAAANFERLAGTGVRVVPFSEEAADRELERADVAIDAIFGLGFHGTPKDPYAAAMNSFEMHEVPVVSVDIPSGVESDTGRCHGSAIHPTVTVTFGAPKIGNILPPGACPYGSKLEVADIGYPRELVTRVEPYLPYQWPITLLEIGDVTTPSPKPPNAHKRDAVVLVVAGSRRMTGAPALVASGAYRAGAGLVILAVPGSILPVVQSAVREATFLPLPEDSSGVVSERAWDVLSEILSTVHAVAVGPGLSREGGAPAFVRRLVRESPVPLVIDADAINAFAGSAADLAERNAEAVITPHHGELARLMGISTHEVRDDLLGSVRAASRETSMPVLLKGWPNLLAVPEGNVKIERTGTSALATAGTGDVLTGVISGFLAHAGGADDGAIAGAQVHGLAGRVAVERIGPGITAGDVAESIPEAIRRLREDA
ncbi:MAG: NAD(P)H-hydrate dehydratase [Actinomycetota bacterium]